MRTSLDRRSFMHTAAAGLAVSAGGSSLAGPIRGFRPQSPFHPLIKREILRSIRIGPKKIFVRRRLSSWTSGDFEAYATAVAAMKARPITDPTSWLFQANIHGAPAADGANPAWSKCAHNSTHFLSWHRMYLYWWERIVRKASGDPDFAIGYWRYDPDDQVSRVMPEPFRLPADAANPLFVSNRSAAINGGAPMPDSTVAADIALEKTVFLGSTQFQRSLEVSPHNGVHVQVGGGMGAVNLAARDPIFWTHHANIDRVWKRWLAQGGGRADPTADNTFMNTVFTFFDDDGDAVEMTGKEVLDTVDQLDYRYDDDCHRLPPPVKLLAAREAAMQERAVIHRGPEPRFRLAGERQSIKLGVAAETDKQLRSVVERAAAGRPDAVVLSIQGLSASAVPDVTYEVYINLPEDQKAQPTFRSPHYAGNLALFGLGEEHGPNHDHHAGHGAGEGHTVDLDITPVLAALRERALWTEGDIEVTFVPRQAGVEPGERIEKATPVEFSRVALVRAQP